MPSRRREGYGEQEGEGIPETCGQENNHKGPSDDEDHPGHDPGNDRSLRGLRGLQLPRHEGRGELRGKQPHRGQGHVSGLEGDLRRKPARQGRC